MSEIEDEWSLLSYSYEDVLLPRLEPLYKYISNLVVNHIQLNKTQDKYKILDYGTGPGEPILTLVKLLEENQICHVELEGTDPSMGMISIAKERLSKLNLLDINVDLNITNNLSTLNNYDIIISSLVLPYIFDKRGLLRAFHKNLQSDGLLISCHWPHPSHVPFLSLLKRINLFMSKDEHISSSDLETDVTFTCANEEITKQLLIDEGFLVQEYVSLSLPMSFPDIRTFLSFSRIAASQ